jgi:hypothetical protein
MFGLWRSRWHYVEPGSIPDLVAQTSLELWNARDLLPSMGSAHPVVADLRDGRWRYCGWWSSADAHDELPKREDPQIYDKVRYDRRAWSGGDPKEPVVHPTHTLYISQH